MFVPSPINEIGNETATVLKVAKMLIPGHLQRFAGTFQVETALEGCDGPLG